MMISLTYKLPLSSKSEQFSQFQTLLQQLVDFKKYKVVSVEATRDPHGHMEVTVGLSCLQPIKAALEPLSASISEIQPEPEAVCDSKSY